MIDWLVPFSVLPTLGLLGFLAVYRILRGPLTPDLRGDLAIVQRERAAARALPQPAASPYREPAPRRPYAPPSLREITGLDGRELAAMLEAAFAKVCRVGNVNLQLLGPPDPAFDAAAKELRRAMPVRVPDDRTVPRRM